jgi:hypothetical protein
MSYAFHCQHEKKEHCSHHSEKMAPGKHYVVINTGIEFVVALSGECAKVNLKF